MIIYELIQVLLYGMLKIIAIIFPHKKLKLFLQLRSPSNFYANINSAAINLKEIILTNKINGNIIHPPIFWFHVSSAGEMEQAIPIARKLHEKFGAYFFVTYYSFSAKPFLKNFPATIGTSGLPLDIRFIYNKLTKILPLTKIFFVRYDIWPSLLLACNKKNLEISLISASKIKTKKGIQAFISKKWNNLFYKYFSFIFAVSIEDLNYFKNLLPNVPIYLAGDAKWARANERAHSLVKTKSDPLFFNFINFCKKIKLDQNKKILVIGSPHSHEYELALKISKLKNKFLVIYVPHDIELKLLQTLSVNFQNSGFNSVLYSSLVNEIISQDNLSVYLNPNVYNHNLIIIDTVGLLAEIYQVADAALIGGGFDGQIHNVLEAAAHGVPTMFGSSYSRAREASELVNSNSAVTFESVNNLFHFLSTWVNFEGGLVKDAADTPETILANVKLNAVQLFRNLPDTSEVIFNALSVEPNQNA